MPWNDRDTRSRHFQDQNYALYSVWDTTEVFFLLFIWLFVDMSVYALELMLQAVVSHPTWVLGNKLFSPDRTANDLNQVLGTFDFKTITALAMILLYYRWYLPDASKGYSKNNSHAEKIMIMTYSGPSYSLLL